MVVCPFGTFWCIRGVMGYWLAECIASPHIPSYAWIMRVAIVLPTKKSCIVYLGAQSADVNGLTVFGDGTGILKSHLLTEWVWLWGDNSSIKRFHGKKKLVSEKEYEGAVTILFYSSVSRKIGWLFGKSRERDGFLSPSEYCPGDNDPSKMTILERCKEQQWCVHLGYLNESALVNHSLNLGHQILFSEAEMLFRSVSHGCLL